MVDFAIFRSVIDGLVYVVFLFSIIDSEHECFVLLKLGIVEA